MPKVGDVIADKYLIDDVLGEGGMGAVFAATHTITQKRVAVKWMHQALSKDEEAVQRFVREAQAAGRIDHPNVVDVYDVGKHGDTVFLVMEYLYGEPLTALLSRGQLEPLEAIRLLMPALRGVAQAHKQGVVHRDIKPDNIFLCRSPDGRPREAKVLDFGISKISAQDGQMSPRLTRTGAVMGTPYYMSPEQVRGSSEVGKQVDVYAFGVILYEALTGQVPFHADTFSALILEIATGTPKWPLELRPDLPPPLGEVVMKAMAREPAERYPDIETFARALEPFAEGMRFDLEGDEATGGHVVMHLPGSAGTAAVTVTPFTSEVPVKIPVARGFRLAAAGGIAALLAAAGVGAWIFMGQQGSPDANEIRPAVAPPSLPAPVETPEPPVVVHEVKPAVPVPEQPPAPDLAARQAEEARTKAEADRAEAERRAALEKAAQEKAQAEERRKRGDHRSSRTGSRAAAPTPAAPTPPPAPSAQPAPPQEPTAPSRRRPRSGRTGGLGLDDF